ncbi:hypothetical protein SAMN04489834_3491 [Microterricola viridarii]|uniref:Uncharacterized protein n=1 Tax=Microterricola viridarii TaxID=412690 RepID=A0A1H1ZK98_9MICO|nr:hypothetical protein SAMN04489834_3491 [Microterricola viridarii]
MLLARLVAGADLGLTLTTISLQTTLLGIASLGITTLILCEYSRENYAAVRAALKLSISSSVVGGVLAATLPLLVIGDHPMKTLTAVLLAFVVSVDKNVEAQVGISIACGISRTPGTSILLRAVAALAIFLGLVPTDTNPVLAFSIGKAAAAMIGLVHFLDVTFVPQTGSRVSQIELMRVLWPLAANNSLAALRSLDTVIVTAVSGATAAGLYAAASKSLAPFGFAASALSAVLMPTSAVMSGPEARRRAWKIAK